ncbi:MAG: flippase [Gemmatimonadetes bacterium]|nr:flippase [Gemmatimonadota bacterium]
MATPPPSRTFVGNTVFASVSAASAVFLLALLVVAGRLLGDADYGKFSFALALATVFETFIDFGLKDIATRSVARDRQVAYRLMSNTFGLKLVLAIVTLAALVLAARLLRADPDVRLACYLLGLASVLRSYLLTARHLLMGLERFDLDSVVVIGDRILLLVFGAGALWIGTGVVGLAASFVVARAVAVVLSYGLSASQVGRFGFSFEWRVWVDLQRSALPFGAFVIVLYLYNYIDTIMLGVLRGDAETGLYSAAYRIYEGLSSIPAILQAVLAPRLARHFVQDRSRHRWLARLGLMSAVVIAVPTTGVALIAAGPIVRLLFGEDYVASAGVFQILALGLLFVFPLFVRHAEAISANAERLLLRTAVIGCLVNVLLNSVLIPLFGMHGAAIATVVGEFASIGYLSHALRRHPGTDGPPPAAAR